MSDEIIKSLFSDISENYQKCRVQEPYGKSSSMWIALTELSEALKNSKDRTRVWGFYDDFRVAMLRANYAVKGLMQL